MNYPSPCYGQTNITIPAPTSGNAVAIPIPFASTQCTLHMLGGPSSNSQCGMYVPVYSGWCCDNGNGYFVIPALGCNTTVETYADCNGTIPQVDSNHPSSYPQCVADGIHGNYTRHSPPSMSSKRQPGWKSVALLLVVASSVFF